MSPVLKSFLARLRPATKAARRGRPADRRPRATPRVERLEDRWVPALTLRFEEPGYPALTITDGSPFDSDATAGRVTYNSTVSGTYGTFSINVTAVQTKPALGDPSKAWMAFSTLDVSRQAGVQSLTITAADTGYTDPSAAGNPLGFQSQIGGTFTNAGGTITLQHWANASNASPLSGPTTVIPAGSVSPGQLGPFIGSSPPSFSQTLNSTFTRGSGPYSLFAQAVLKFNGTGTTSFGSDAFITGPVVSQPTINTVAGSTIVIGSGNKLTDQAVLAGGNNPTGTITFDLYSPSNVLVDTETVSVTGNGPYFTPTGYTPTEVGTYLWKATYSGDANNTGATDNGQNENQTVDKAGPSINTVAGGTVVIGSGVKLSDQAVLSGGYNPTGTITFQLYSPSNVLVDTEMVTVTGNGPYFTPTGYLPTEVGTYLWKASYSGDASNTPAADNGQNENQTVDKASPAINTVAGSTIVIGSGAKLTDTAQLTGGYGTLTGTITFTLLSPSNVAVYSNVVTVSGAGTYTTATGTNPGGFTPTAVGTYLWTATYSGDANNTGATDNGQNENQTVDKAGPSINTVAGGTVVIGSGAKLTDQAVLAGGYNPTGTITFQLYSPSNVLVDTETVTVTGNGPYFTPVGYLPTEVGTYLWKASYSGDASNTPAADNGQNENQTVDKASPAINTVAGSTIVIGSGAKLTDTAQLTGGYGTLTGTITFTLLSPSNVAVYSNVVTVSGAGTYTTATGTNPGGFTPTAVGTYLWTATYSGDANNTGATDNGQNENQTVNKASPQVLTTASPGGVVGVVMLKDSAVVSGSYTGTGSITFTLYNPANVLVDTEVVTISGNGTYTTPVGYVPTTVGTYTWKASYSGDALNNGAIDQGGAAEQAVIGKAGPAINTVAGSTIVIGSGNKLTDTAQLTGGYGTLTGTITFTLLSPSNVAVYSNVVTVSGAGTYTTATGTNPGGFTPTAVGTYLWTATYSGDANNTGATDNGQNENQTVNKANPSINTVAGSTIVIGSGNKLTDTAQLTGGYGTLTGTITFTLYNPSNVAVYSNVVTVNGAGTYTTAGGTNPGGFTPTTVGTYLWNATYSGNANNAGATDNGQNENQTVNKASPAVFTTASPGGVVGVVTLKDSAVVSGSYIGTGSITFTLYNPANVLVDTEVVTISGNGTYTTPVGYVPTTVGTYTWKASYSGDALNNGAIDQGGAAEQAKVTLAAKIDIEKTTNGPTNSNPTTPDYDNEDAVNGAGVPVLVPGSTVTWTYKVTNTGGIAFASADVVVTDDNGTPGNTADDLGTTKTGAQKINFLSVLVGNADSILDPGESWLYTATGTVLDVNVPTGSAITFTMTGSTALTGAAGNIRTYTAGGVSVNASASSRNSGGTWSASYLGAYGGGLGVTNNTEDGSNNTHTVDNAGQTDYVAFEFSEKVVIDSAFLGYVVGDSDLSVWIGTVADPFNNHLTLSDALLSGFFTEVNSTTLTTTRTANLNAGQLAGNVIIIAAKAGDADDFFKIQNLIVNKVGGVYENTGYVTAPGTPGDSDLSHYKNPNAAPGIDIEKTTNGPSNSNPTAPNYDNEDATNGSGVPILVPGSSVTWTYQVTNTGNVPFAFNQVVVTDDNGTPGTTADDLSTTGGQITFLSVQTGDADNILEPGEVWLYKATGTVQNVAAAPAGSAVTLATTGSSALTGAAGNLRSYTAGGISVNASAFSRDKTTGAWSAAFLGAYGGGLGVTDGSEDGANNTHTVDNGGTRDNYVLFEFNQSVVVDAVSLGYVVGDSDLTVWIGTIPGAFNVHQTLSDALLTSLGFTEVNLGGGSTRTADLNAGLLAGNVLVVAAKIGDTVDMFKIGSVTVRATAPGVYENKGSVSVPGDSDSDLSHYKNPAGQINIVKYVKPATTTTSGGEGLTPGFWKQSQHFQFWVGYTQTDSFNTVFGVSDPDSPTLLGALQRGGGGYKALGRHAVAALLNAANDHISFAFTQAQVIALVQNAYATGNFEAAKNTLAAENEKEGVDVSDLSGPLPPAPTPVPGYGLDANTAPGLVVPVGSQVTFTYVVTNPDGVALKPLVAGKFVTDDNETPGTTGDDFLPSPVLDGAFNVGDDDSDGLLDPGEVWIYTYTKTVTSGQHTNVGTAVGQPVDSSGNPLGGTVSDADVANWFGGAPTGTGSISGKKYEDVSGNGLNKTASTNSPADVPLGGVTIYLDTDNDGKLDSGEVFTVTAADGSYSFIGLAPGTYKVREVVPDGWVRTNPKTTDYYSVGVTSGSSATNNDFANAEQCDLNTITGVSFKVVHSDGTYVTVTDLRGNTRQGDVIKVTFTVNVPTGQTHDVSLVSYLAPSAVFDANTASQQTIYDLATGTFGPGTYSLTVGVPNSYYQVDFVCGLAIDQLGPNGSNIFYTPQNRLESADNGGCQVYGANQVTGEFATVGFWKGTNGQNVIKSFNGGSTATALGNWLASSFPSLFGTGNLFIGTASLTGKTNAQIATIVAGLSTATTTKSAYAQAFATALGIYADTRSLGGQSLANNGYAVTFGFNISLAGGGVSPYSIGTNTGAFPYMGTTPTVLAILQKVNASFTPSATNPLFYSGDATKTGQANTVLNGINTGGDIALVTSDSVSTAEDQTLITKLRPLNHGDLVVAVDALPAELAGGWDRVEDVVAAINASLGDFGVSLTVVAGGTDVIADIYLHFAATSVIGGVPEGVLGVTEAGGVITVITGWNYYFGSEPAGIGAGQYDFETVIAHELGHAVGLGHSLDTGSVMFPFLDTAQVRRQLTGSDLAAVAHVENGDAEALRATAAAATPLPGCSCPQCLAAARMLVGSPATDAAAVSVAPIVVDRDATVPVTTPAPTGHTFPAVSIAADWQAIGGDDATVIPAHGSPVVGVARAADPFGLDVMSDDLLMGAWLGQ